MLLMQPLRPEPHLYGLIRNRSHQVPSALTWQAWVRGRGMCRDGETAAGTCNRRPELFRESSPLDSLHPLLFQHPATWPCQNVITGGLFI
jgi:hypothetical protein